MKFEHEDVGKPSISTLVSGILNDAKDLFAQELRLARLELRQDIQKTKTAGVALGIGLGITGLGLVMLLLMIVHLIDTYTNLPLWGSYGIVGVVLAAVGVGLLMMGKNKVAEVDFIPQQTAEAVKEDVGWIRARMRFNSIGKTRAPR
jgi:membrane protein